MAASARELFDLLFAGRTSPGAEIDTREFAGAEFERRARELIAADAPVLFTAPGGGAIGEMGGPFAGPRGFQEGWAEWLASWEEWNLIVEEVEEIDGDRLLFFVTGVGRMAGSGQTLEAPAGAMFTARDGKFVKIEHFLDQEQARRAAELR